VKVRVTESYAFTSVTIDLSDLHWATKTSG
jgi:hypothetical protein